MNRAPTFASDSGKVTTEVGGDRDTALDIAVQADGRILLAGQSVVGSELYFSLAGYNADGTLDTSFGIGGKVLTPGAGDDIDSLIGVSIRPDGKILLAGTGGDGHGGQGFILLRYLPDGSLDSSFGNKGRVVTDFGAYEDGNSVALQSNGKIVVAGFVRYGSGETDDHDFAVARYNTNGTLDTGFGGDGKVTTEFSGDADMAYALAIQEDGRILVAGQTSADGSSDIALARYKSDGSLDTSFSGDGRAVLDIAGSYEVGYGIFAQDNGKILVAGNSSGEFSFIAARFNPDGAPD